MQEVSTAEHLAADYEKYGTDSVFRNGRVVVDIACQWFNRAVPKVAGQPSIHGGTEPRNHLHALGMQSRRDSNSLLFSAAFPHDSSANSTCRMLNFIDADRESRPIGQSGRVPLDECFKSQLMDSRSNICTFL